MNNTKNEDLTIELTESNKFNIVDIYIKKHMHSASYEVFQRTIDNGNTFIESAAMALVNEAILDAIDVGIEAENGEI